MFIFLSFFDVYFYSFVESYDFGEVLVNTKNLLIFTGFNLYEEILKNRNGVSEKRLNHIQFEQFIGKTFFSTNYAIRFRYSPSAVGGANIQAGWYDTSKYLIIYGSVTAGQSSYTCCNTSEVRQYFAADTSYHIYDIIRNGSVNTF